MATIGQPFRVGTYGNICRTLLGKQLPCRLSILPVHQMPWPLQAIGLPAKRQYYHSSRKATINLYTSSYQKSTILTKFEYTNPPSSKTPLLRPSSKFLRGVSSPCFLPAKEVTFSKPSFFNRYGYTPAQSLRCFSTSKSLQKDTQPASQKPLKSSIASFSLKFVKFFIFLGGSILLTVTLFVLGFFVYDFTTYNQQGIADQGPIQVPSLALRPEKGGPKNLPIYEAPLDQYDSSEKQERSHKPRLVILGCGWGSIALLKKLYHRDYEVIVISPTNYFLFTPMLPSATVGTLDVRSLVEPVRNILNKISGIYLKGSAEDILFDEQLVEVSSKNHETGEEQRFYVPYDKIVVGVGSVSNTHGVKGLEFCKKLKTVDDVWSIRQNVVENIERACLPTTSDEERKRLLSFVICGGGPTGVELAAELFDTVNEDLLKRYPNIIRSEVSVHIVQSRSHILNTYDEKIAEYAESRFAKDGVDVIINSRVNQILPDRIQFTQTLSDGTKVMKELPFGMCIWSTGVDMAPLTKAVTKRLGPEYQQNRRAIETDQHLRIIGAPAGTAYAIGDCSTVRTSLVTDIEALLKQGLINHKRYAFTNTDGDEESQTGPYSRRKTWKRSEQNIEDIKSFKLSFEEFLLLAEFIKRKTPQATVYLQRLEELFLEYDRDHNGSLSYNELKEMLQYIDKKVTSLPATAQRAFQQGKYLGKKLHRLASLGESINLESYTNDAVLNREGYLIPVDKQDSAASKVSHTSIPYQLRDIDSELFKPFVYKHLGSLAYIGNGAVFDIGGTSYFGGILSMYLWRSAYFAQCVSFRTRALMFMDWLKRGLFGRDLSGV